MRNQLRVLCGSLFMLFSLQASASAFSDGHGILWRTEKDNFVSMHQDFTIKQLAKGSSVGLRFSVEHGVRRVLFRRSSPIRAAIQLYTEDNFCFEKVEYSPDNSHSKFDQFRMRMGLPVNVIKELNKDNSYSNRLEGLSYIIINMHHRPVSNANIYTIEFYDANDQLLGVNSQYEKNAKYAFEWETYVSFMCGLVPTL